jgi:hypothetical protein
MHKLSLSIVMRLVHEHSHRHPLLVTTQLQGALGPERRLDNEAERLRLKQLLLTMERSALGTSATDSPRSGSLSSSRATSAGQARAARNSSSLQDALRSSTTSSAAVEASPAKEASISAATDAAGKTSTRRLPAPPKIPELVSGHYVLDFGCVTKGINKSRKVKMTNMSTQQVRALQAPHIPAIFAMTAASHLQPTSCNPLL